MTKQHCVVISVVLMSLVAIAGMKWIVGLT